MGPSEMRLHHAADAAEMHAHLVALARLVEGRPQSFTLREMRLGRLGIEDIAQSDHTSRHRHDVVVERARMNKRARLVAIEQIHDIRAATKCAEAHSPAMYLPNVVISGVMPSRD